MEPSYELFDHTADMGIRVRAATLPELLAPAGEGLYAVIGNLVAGEEAEPAAFDIAGKESAELLRAMDLQKIAEDLKGLAECVDRFRTQTGWTPRRVEHVAGAFRFTEYNWFKTWAMRYIQSRKDPPARSGEDVEYTDWAALDTLIDSWLSGL